MKTMMPVRCEVCDSVMHKNKRWVYHCGNCGYLISTLRPAEGSGIPGLEALRRRNFEIILDRLEEVKPLAHSRILEVGSAWGWFLEAADRRGARVRGIEPESANAKLAIQHGLDVEIGRFPEDLRDRGPYDIIIFNDVFEHLSGPTAIIRHTEQLLSKDGILILNIPSSDGVLFKIATILDSFGASSWHERLWQKDLPSPHISYFNPKNLQMLVENRSDLRLVKTFTLNSVSRDGLFARIGISHRAVSGILTFVGIWAASFLLPFLPSDIYVGVFRK
jgi:2-polyprenyl-3-methyl-5-hydroxy-6-metoxy-1,4-benzoquinol methylase